MSEKKAPAKRRSRATIKAEDDTPSLPGPQPTTSTSRKRKAANPPPRDLLDVHASREERRSELVAVPPHILERQRHRRPHSPSDPPYRRMPTDIRSARKPSVPNITPRPSPRSRRSSMQGPERNMLQHAWHTVMTTDPLVDSDEECHDGHVRTDYIKRMQVISRLRGRPPTPEGEEPTYGTPMTARSSHFEAHAGRVPSVF